MNRITKFALGAIAAGMLASAAAAPANAGVSVGVGIGVPGPGYGYHDRYCRFHPCGRYGYGAPIGVGVGVADEEVEDRGLRSGEAIEAG